MRTRLMTVSIPALAIAGMITLSAQTPQNPPAQPQTPPAAAQQATDVQRPAAVPDQAITIVGCLKPESAVPALKPNIVEKAGITEDYILTDVKMAASSSVSGLAVAPKYEIEGIDRSELKKHINHQVELTGMPVQPATGGSDAAPDFKAISMKMVSATCAPAK